MNNIFDLEKAKSRIEEFRAMEENWDGEGAEAIDEKACQSAIEFIEKLDWQKSRPSGIAPSPEGEIVFYWHEKENEKKSEYFEVNFEPGGKIYICWLNDEKVWTIESMSMEKALSFCHYISPSPQV